MSTPNTVREYFECLRGSNLLEPGRLEAYLDGRGGSPLPRTPADVSKVLVRDGLLTHYQAEQLLAGRWKNFFVSGKYKVLERLGSGGMASVFLCEHRVMRRLVALKVLPGVGANDPATLTRFHREARAIGQLRHPNIVGAHDIDQSGKLHFMVMEYVEGGNLDELVRERGPLDPLRASHYIRQAAQGLQHAHEAGLIHRDIKPANLLLDANGIVKLLDLGLARFSREESDNLTNGKDFRSVLGTLDYLAPEQAIDSHHVDIRADIYGLGATFYFLLSGQGLFHEASVAEKLSWHQCKKAKSVRAVRPDLPAGLVAIVDKMLARDPAARYQTPAEVVEALGPWAAEPIAPLEEWALERLSPLAREIIQKQSGPRASASEWQAAAGSSPRSGVMPDASNSWASPPKRVESSSWASPSAPIPAQAPGATARPAAGHRFSIPFGLARHRWWWAAGAATVVLAVGVGILGASAGPSKPLAPPIPTDAPRLKVQAPRPSARPSPARPTVAAPAVAGAEPADSVDLPRKANTLGMTLVLIPTGEFLMGSPDADGDALEGERPGHPVRITKPYYLAAHEVTVAQFRAFVEATGYRTEAESSGKGGTVWDASQGRMVQSPEISWRAPGITDDDDVPVVQVSWNDAAAFCRWLSLKERAPYRLPTEAEWEYACRAGTATRWSTGDDEAAAGAVGWSDASSGFQLHPVGKKAPNRFGLFDMHGNVSEWCADWHGPYADRDEAEVDPTGPIAGANRVVRGGSWADAPGAMRSASREGRLPGSRSYSHGFRVCQSAWKIAAVRGSGPATSEPSTGGR